MRKQNYKKINKKVTHISDDSLRLVETLFRTRFQVTTRRTAKFDRFGLTVGLGSVFLNGSGFLGTNLSGPFGTFFLSGITLGHVFAFLVLDSFALNNIIFNIVFMISCCASGFINGSTNFLSWAFADQRSVANFDLQIFKNFNFGVELLFPFYLVET